MSRTFKVRKDYYDTGERIFTKEELTIETGLTILVGCNGTGKTTLLHHIARDLEKNKIPHISYDNFMDGGRDATQAALWKGDTSLVATLAFSSEGEKIMVNLGEKSAAIGRFVKSHRDAKEIWFLFDAVDSGFSIDNIVDLKKYLFDVIRKDLESSGIDCYIVVSANSYEMCNGEQCFDARNGKYLTFKSYDEYRKFVLKSKEEKENREYKKRNRRN